LDIQVIKARQLSSAMSAANAIGDHLRTWLVTGSDEGDFVSLAVVSDGSYGIEQGGTDSALGHGSMLMADRVPAATICYQYKRNQAQSAVCGARTQPTPLCRSSAGLVFSFPVTCPGDGTYAIVQDLPLNDRIQAALAVTEAELKEEMAAAKAILGV